MQFTMKLKMSFKEAKVLEKALKEVFDVPGFEREPITLRRRFLLAELLVKYRFIRKLQYDMVINVEPETVQWLATTLKMIAPQLNDIGETVFDLFKELDRVEIAIRDSLDRLAKK